MAGWGQKFESVVISWEGGVRTSARPDLISASASPSAVNGSWEFLGDGTAIVAKRAGCEMVNGGTSIDSGIAGQLFYEKRNVSTDVYTQYHILVAEDGDVHVIDDDDGSVVNYPGVGFVADPEGGLVSGAIAQNLAFVVANSATTASGVAGQGLKFDGTSWSIMGITQPGAAPSAVSTGSGVMTGTYDFAVSYYNSNTGHQSSRSAETQVVCTSKQVTVSWVASADAQVTHVNVHVRSEAISTGFYQATSIAIGSTSVTLNISDDDYNALITLSPDEDENDPVPDGTKFLVWHNSRMFAASATVVYYSKVELPESFDLERNEPINNDDGQQITGMISAFDELVIFKDHAVYALVGDGPNDWVLRKVSEKIGCSSPGSIVFADGVLYWWSSDGPILWDGINDPQRLGKALIAQSITPQDIDTSRLENVVGIDDRQNERILWAVTQAGDTRNTMIIPYKYRLGGFEGQWFSVEPCSWGRGKDSNGFEWVYAGNYGGRVFKWGTGDFDGLPAGGGFTGTFTATTTSITTITGSGFDTATMYADLYVVVVNETTKELFDKKRIASSTATVLTLAENFDGLAVGTAYRFYIAGIDFTFDTKWQDDGLPFVKKRYEFFFLQTQAENASTMFVQISFDYGNVKDVERTLDLTSYDATVSSSSEWDVDFWDVAEWTSVIAIRSRHRMAATGLVWRARVQQTEPRVGFSLFKVGMQGEHLTSKR